MNQDECYGCTRRHVGCHSDCPGYEKVLARNAQKRAAKKKDTIYRGYRMGVVETILTKDAVRRQRKDRAKRKR